MPAGWISKARQEFHATLLANILTRNVKGIPANADVSSSPSVCVANEILDQLGPTKTAVKLPGQSAGASFEAICASFIESCMENMGHLRPGEFSVEKGGGIAKFDQYAHLYDLEKIAKSNREIATALGSDYLIKPDIVIAREAESDDKINAAGMLVDTECAQLTSLRKSNQQLPILHASISCKWTLRSDRAQNARSEALNLVRNRKGRLPHVVAITGEPLPSRIASLALGTGDIDCVYHFALNELKATLANQKRDDALDLLNTMIEGKRVRDISDLPLDLVT